MKKLLAILGTLSIGASGATLVVACNGPKTQTKTQDSTPENRQNKPATETKKDKDSDKSKKQDPKEEKHEKKPSTDEHKKPSELVSYSWNSAFKDNITGEDIDLALDTVVIQNNKHYKFFKDSSSSLVADLFDDKIADQVKDAKIRWEKIQKIAKEKAKDKEEAEVLHELVNFSDSLEKELKPLAEKLFQEAKDKEFLTNASNATEDYFKTLDKVKDLEAWAKAKIEKNARVAKEKAKDKEEAEVLHELVNFSDSLEKELKPLAEKLFQEAKDKEFLTNASNATEDYFKTLDTSKEVNEWKHEKERFNKIITNINKKVEELTGSGNSLESVITDVESNLRNYKDSIKDLKNSKEFWKYEMWNYWLEDLLKTLKRH
uniref:Lipoprotein n=1 Tax=Mycoplasma feriruminatoris TaxID=1179777 RepID=A0A654IBZ1_9MOLU|nr:hypothetical protein MF5292_00821 [Mycoplasma feriruminatoris]VZR75787.1 hypothetical protein MF5294_00820 [Mycoplasma feriruminatoris]VZR98501.1 hypothetical protein MF5293_00818 [Mycoplasma feriruminatoris]